jgi:hypothetical protein
LLGKRCRAIVEFAFTSIINLPRIITILSKKFIMFLTLEIVPLQNIKMSYTYNKGNWQGNISKGNWPNVIKLVSCKNLGKQNNQVGIQVWHYVIIYDKVFSGFQNINTYNMLEIHVKMACLAIWAKSRVPLRPRDASLISSGRGRAMSFSFSMVVTIVGIYLEGRSSIVHLLGEDNMVEKY